MPAELRICLARGGRTSLLVLADCDHDCAHPDALKNSFWNEAEHQGISRQEFELVTFAFAKDRLENWIEFLLSGKTDEQVEGARTTHDRQASDAAHKLAEFCRLGLSVDMMPPSLQWSSKNWRSIVARLK